MTGMLRLRGAVVIAVGVIAAGGLVAAGCSGWTIGGGGLAPALTPGEECFTGDGGGLPRDVTSSAVVDCHEAVRLVPGDGE